MSSIHDKLEKVRKPRVHIKYEVEIEGSTIEKELPFTVGVLGDFAGNHPGEIPKSLKERKFITIDRSNFDAVMTHIKPGLLFHVDNTLTDDKAELEIELTFKALEDFEPVAIVQQVPELKKLKAMRDALRDVLSKTDRSDQLELLLEAVLQDNTKLHLLARELGLDVENTDIP